MIIFVKGKPRTGKTALITLLANLFADEGAEVYTNLSLFDSGGKGEFVNGDWTGVKLPNVHEITPYDLVGMLKGGRVSPERWLCLHEIYAWMSSHKALSDINNFGATFVCQSAKLGYNWLIDSQITMKVDDNYRILADFRYEAEKLEDRFVYWELNPDFPNEDIRTDRSFCIPFEFMSLYWDRYDTYTPLRPIGMDELEAKMEKLEPKILKRSVAELVDLLYDKRYEYGIESVRDVTPNSVKYALMMEERTLAHAVYVGVGLKLKLKNS